MIITVGTSIEAGTGLEAGQSWPQRLAARAPAYTFRDMSLPGGAYTSNLADGDNLRKHVRAAVALRPDVLILGGPVNDPVSLTDTQPLRQAVFEESYAAQQAGIRVLVMAILPFNDGPRPGFAFETGWWPRLESMRQDYNAWAHDMYGANFIDLGWILHETTTYRGDVRFFRDGLHPQRWTAALIAEVFPLERLS